MAITIISIKSVSPAIRPVWKKMPEEVKADIKLMLGIEDLQLLRTFSIRLIEKEHTRRYQGYARETLLRSTLSFEVLIQNPEGHLNRFTMQRMCPKSPFIRLI